MAFSALRSISRCLLHQPLLLRPPSQFTCQAQRLFASSADDSVQQRIGQLVKENKIVVFMKGTPENPQCGFSNAVVRILEAHGLPPDSPQYSAHDVLTDEDIRSGVKTFSDWPTIPQVFFNGEFVGGCDILLDMHKTGSMPDELLKIGIKSAMSEK